MNHVGKDGTNHDGKVQMGSIMILRAQMVKIGLIMRVLIGSITLMSKAVLHMG